MDSESVLLGAVQGLVSDARERLHLDGELILVLPRWMWERYGQEALTASFRRLNVEHVELVDTWDGDSAQIAQMLLYQKGTWHTNHFIGETDPNCQGCQVT